ncbi:MAG: VOC family protein [Candidatus Saccharibacteria bacterium]
MISQLNPYVSFKNNARQAMEFYQSVFGGTLDIQTFKDQHASVDPRQDNLVMHAMLTGASGITFMGSDAPMNGEYTAGNNFSMSLSGDNEGELRAYFGKLSDQGTISAPLEKALWGDVFGMCVDRYGITWLVNIFPVKAQS